MGKRRTTRSPGTRTTVTIRVHGIHLERRTTLYAEPDAWSPKQTMHIFRNLLAGFDGVSLAGKQRR
jgi:hypothetical protein